MAGLQSIEANQAVERTTVELPVHHFARQKSKQLRLQQDVRAAMPNASPLLFGPANFVRVRSGDIDLGLHENSVAGADADAHLRIESHQLRNVQIERGQFIRPQRNVRRRRRTMLRRQRRFAEQQFLQFGE